MNVRETRRGNLTTFIEMSMPRLENELSCICVLGISMLSLSTTLIFDFLNFSDVWYVLSFSLFVHYQHLLDIYHIEMFRVSSITSTDVFIDN